ncbi:hypothetical protein [Lacicoccus qingdaonensis]|uniref:Uncharacterized protein n=1 Tax=Lacicoccus qingdaonensis TaxID=576118 RepID=A0A1G9EZC8_9BACL|nr:hypothetical protein [Salinicoccus qingdaonensis]SDK81536.1 hypothetical protein SAMN05216216_11062 [Salinicoccus qingdaonensis]
MIDKLLEENRLLRVANDKLQAEKEELLKINENNASEYMDLMAKYNSLIELKRAPLPDILKREVSE